jgi:DNA-binding CsgD family transcriptional regulator/tetratricopeptide (TPR) repeat protein
VARRGLARVWQMPYSALRPRRIVEVMALDADPFVGRQAEVELLAASLEAASQEQPRFMLVIGEAGIGKTRLLREAADLAVPLGLRVLSGTAIEGGIAMPYLPLLGPLGECTDGASDAPAAVVRRLVTGQPSRGGSDAAAAARVVESIFTVLVREPTLLLLDDVHWADGSTVAVLDYLSHRARSESLAVVVAARDDEGERLARLPIADGRRFAPLRLRRLTEEEVAQHVEALLRRTPEPGLVSTVFDRSAGNPFFVEQLLAEGLDDPPASLRALMLRRLTKLSERARRAIDALAVFGRPADEGVIAAVAGIRDDEAAAALREAAGHGVAVPVDEGFAFRHPLFPEVVVGALPGSKRRRLHRSAAVVLGASGADPADIATHWWEAGDADQAWAAALEAAERAERAFAFAETRLHLERALQVWPDGAEGRVDCLLRAADAAWLAGDADVALAMAQRGLAEGALDDAALQLALGQYAWDAGERAVAAAAFARAAELVRPDAPAATRSLALWALARARIAHGRYAEAHAAAVEGVAIAHHAGDAFAEANALIASGMTSAEQGSLAGLADLERSVSLSARGASPSVIGHGYHFLTLLLHLAGALERTLEVAVAGIDVCERLGLARSHASDLRARAALVLLELGRWDEADAVVRSAEPRGLPLLARALLAMRRGHLDRAELELERAAVASAIAGPGALELGGELPLARAERAWLGGDLAAAWSALDELPETSGVWGASAEVQRARLASRLAADDPRHAAPRAPQARHPDAALDAALRAEIAAERRRASGTSDPQLWAACTRAWTAARRAYDRTYARVREAEALFAVDERGPAKEALREAAAAASSLGARPLRALADDLGRRARVSPEPPRSRQVDRDEPTRRELDVLMLLDEGLTNREIAARLFISPKTVGIHVSRLHRKLDAHTRGQAVAVARRRGLLV